MGRYEDLLVENDYIDVIECSNLPKKLSGIWLGDMILINRNLPITNKLETLAEELAHNELSHGNILDQNSFINRKFENYARRLAYEKLIPLKDLVNAYLQGIHNLYELACFFEVTEQFILETLEHYKQKHGYSVCCDGYIIQFEPLRVFEHKN